MTRTERLAPAFVQANVIDNESQAVEVAENLAIRFVPGADDRDRQQLVPHAELEELRASGLLGITVPVSLGGADVSTRTLVDVIRTLATADSSIAQVLQNHFVFVRAFLDHGSDGQREYFSREILSGKRFGNALSERNVGDTKTGVLTTTLTAIDGSTDFSLNGRKFYTTGALTAQWIPVRTKNANSEDSIAYVPRDAPGLEVLDDWKALGQRGTHSGTTILDNVRVPADHVVIWKHFSEKPSTAGAFGQIIHAAIDVGIAEAALAAAVEFVRNRSRAYADSPFDRATEDHHVLGEVGRLAVQVRGARAALNDAAETLDRAGRHPSDIDATEASISTATAKVLGAEAAVQVANELFAIAGTHSTDQRYGLDRYWRDARTHTLHDPNRWKYHHIGNHLLNDIHPRGPLL